MFLGSELYILDHLCGEQWKQSVTLVTTMWDKASSSELAERREEVLKKIYWKKMIDQGAALDRFLNTPDSAWSIVNRVVPRYETESIQPVQLKTSDLIIVWVLSNFHTNWETFPKMELCR